MRHTKCKGCGAWMQNRLFRTTTCRFCGRKRRPVKEFSLALCALLGSAALIGAVTIASFSWQAAKDLGFIESIKRPSVHFATDEDFKVIASDYPDASQYLSPFDDRIDGSKAYALVNNCATSVVITNNYDKEMHVSNMRIEATEIKADNEPRIKGSLFPNNDGIGIRLTNDGWAAATNLQIRAESKTGSLEEYFGKQVIDVRVPLVDKASTAEVQFLRNSDLVKQGIEDFEITLSASDDVRDDVYIEGDTVSFYVRGSKLDMAYGKGGPSHNVYGVKIDSSSESFCRESPISENANPGRNVCIPVCFFPDQSCSMKVRLSFDVSKGDMVETISTETVELHFLVPSIYNDHKGIDVDDRDAMALEEFGIVDRRETPVPYQISGEAYEF